MHLLGTREHLEWIIIIWVNIFGNIDLKTILSCTWKEHVTHENTWYIVAELSFWKICADVYIYIISHDPRSLPRYIFMRWHNSRRRRTNVYRRTTIAISTLSPYRHLCNWLLSFPHKWMFYPDQMNLTIHATKANIIKEPVWSDELATLSSIVT